MQFTIVTALLVASASASYLPKPAYGHPAPAVEKNGTAPVWVTEVVTALTTYCPEATELTHAGKTYTVSSATTLTISDCPCTVSYTAPPVSSSSVAPVVTSVTPVKSVTPVAPVVPTTYTTPAAPYVYTNATIPVAPATSAPSASHATSALPVATTNAASNAIAGSGAVLAGVFGVVAYLL